ncbi:MAG: FmdB family zinc ribbon protein [Acidobacteriota bacterium]
MPTYEYRCKNCQHTLEEFQSMKDEPLVMCPVCHTPNLVRIIGNGAGLIFKGQGFYLTDYKKGTSEATTSSAASKPKENGAKPASADDAAGKTADKPAEKNSGASEKSAPSSPKAE